MAEVPKRPMSDFGPKSDIGLFHWQIIIFYNYSAPKTASLGSKTIENVHFLSFWDAWNQGRCPGTISPFFFEIMASKMDSRGTHFCDISGVDLKLRFTSIFNRPFHRFLVICLLLLCHFSEEFRKHAPFDFRSTSHTKTLIFRGGATLLLAFFLSNSPPRRRRALVLFFLVFLSFLGPWGRPISVRWGLYFLSCFWSPAYGLRGRHLPQCSRPWLYIDIYIYIYPTIPVVGYTGQPVIS